MMNVKSFYIDDYMKSISGIGILTRDEEHQLAIRYYEQRDQAAFEQLVSANLRFVVKVAHTFKGYGLSMGDLVQEGNIGLLVALKKYNPYRGTRLISYAVFWIRAQINEYIMRSWSLVKLGTTQVERRMFFKVRSARSRFEFEERLDPDKVTEKLAEEFKTDSETVSVFENRFAKRDESTSSSPSTALDPKPREQYACEGPSPEELVAKLEDADTLKETIRLEAEGYDDREKFILSARLLSSEPKALREIAERFQITPERVRQLESRIISNLRKRLDALRFVPQLAA
tara:strand:- start:102 stop:962 length:861 start_codon:yes stop_codon:yes gene_type:complete